VIVVNPMMDAPVIGVIIRHDGVSYLVRSASGRIFKATSADRLRVGETVSVLSGQIVGYAGKQLAPNEYSV
jgi:hypothetical protein